MIPLWFVLEVLGSKEGCIIWLIQLLHLTSLNYLEGYIRLEWCIWSQSRLQALDSSRKLSVLRTAPREKISRTEQESRAGLKTASNLSHQMRSHSLNIIVLLVALFAHKWSCLYPLPPKRSKVAKVHPLKKGLQGASIPAPFWKITTPSYLGPVDEKRKHVLASGTSLEIKSCQNVTSHTVQRKHQQVKMRVATLGCKCLSLTASFWHWKTDIAPIPLSSTLFPLFA